MDDMFGVIIVRVAKKASKEDLDASDGAVELFLGNIPKPYEQ